MEPVTWAEDRAVPVAYWLRFVSHEDNMFFYISLGIEVAK